ncbi:MAG: hypothetical protein H0V46_07465 [Sphingomonas sp.]|nr:hypothetical protein [Sphingomonas sp.]
MSHSEITRIKLDPWSSSSLLQKAIRRGHTALAQQAAAALYKFRGQAIWRRLLNIAVEDVGIADLDLLWEVTRLATDRRLREILGPEDELMLATCAKLALAPKDRSVDYVYCAATKLPASIEERSDLLAKSTADLISIAVNKREPQMKRLSAAMLACTEGRRCERLNAQAVAQLLAAMPRQCPAALQQMIMTLAEQRSHPYPLTLVMLWSLYDWTGGSVGISLEAERAPEWCGGVPLYTFDKHTALGKRAIGLLPSRCPELSALLTQWVRPEQHADVARMATYYADGAPVARRLEWSFGRSLEFIGMHADMMSVGCPYEGVVPLIECVKQHLGLLNELRRAALAGETPG